MPPLALLAGAAAATITPLWPILIATLLIAKELPFYRMNATEWSRLKYGEVYLTVRAFGNEIATNLLPDETFYEVGYEPGLYYYSRKSPPTGILMADHWESGPPHDLFSRRVIQDLEAKKPELLVTTRFWTASPEHLQQPVMRWCLDHYRLFPVEAQHGPFLLYARRGGALEARLSAKKIRPKSTAVRP